MTQYRKWTLHDRLLNRRRAYVDALWDAEPRYCRSADDLFAAILEVADGQGRVVAHPKLAAWFFVHDEELTWQDVARYMAELVARGDIVLLPVRSDTWTVEYPRVAVVLQVAGRDRYPQFRKRVPLPKAVRLAVFDRDGRYCVYCGDTETLHIDHIHPVSKGGTDDLENLQVLCATCNLRKGAKLHVGPRG